MRTKLLAGLALAGLLSGTAGAAETRVITPGRFGAGDAWEAPSPRLVPPGSRVAIRQQHGVTIVAPLRPAPPAPPQRLVPAGRVTDEVVYYADGAVRLRSEPTERLAPPPPVVGAYAPRSPRVVIIPLPGYGVRLLRVE